MNTELNPREVLAHLHEMGYNNVSPELLEDFIKDLRKLIKHDLNKRDIKSNLQRAGYLSTTLPNTTDESGAMSPPSPRHKQHNHPEAASSRGYHFKNEVSCSSSDSSLVPTRRVLRECTKYSVPATQDKGNIPKSKPPGGDAKVLSKACKSCDCLWRTIGCKCCDEIYQREQKSMKTKSKENLIPQRPKSSFIRTWQAKGQSRPGSAGQRCDPVTLYHQYQQVWKQQKMPGENNHSDLRWTIRERMLGQEPHPRSCNCDCRCCPCKLREQDFSKNPRKVSSKILPRGPFHVEGLVKGPLAYGEDSQFVVKQRRLQGTFELKSCSESDKTQNNGSKYKGPSNDHQDVLADWVPVSNDQVIKPKQMEEDVKSNKIDRETNPNFKPRTGETKLTKPHNKALCKYCGLIHHVLNPDLSQNSINSQRSYWPERFAATESNEKRRGSEMNRYMNESSRLSSNKVSAASTPIQSRDERELHRSPSENHSDIDNVFEAAIPINLKNFKGEVKTEITLQKKCKRKICGDKYDKPLFTVATEVKVNKF